MTAAHRSLSEQERVRAHTALRNAVTTFEGNQPTNGVGTIVWVELGRALLAYEATGDHDHGWADKSRPLAPGARCPGGDCLVDRARRLLTEATIRTCGGVVGAAS